MTSRFFLLLIVSLQISPLSVAGTELRFIDGSELRKLDVYDDIPKAFGEKVVVFPDGGRPDAVSFAYCEPYEAAKDSIRTYFERVASIREVTTDSQPKESKYGNQSNQQFVSQEVEKLRAAGFRTNRYSELRIVFPKYNAIAESDQSSSLLLRLVNAHDIFGIPGSILTVERHDDTLEENRTFHLGIPLPTKAHSNTRIVTDTETKMISQFERSTQRKSVEVILTLTNGDPYASFDSLQKFRKALDKCT
jgi:hypothetical protein